MSPLYGAFHAGINQGLSAISRRAVLAGALALPVAARAAGFSEDPLVTRAVDAMGGRPLLSRVKALSWEARADVNAGGRVVGIASRTRCEPFGTARSESWLRDKPEATRTMTVDLAGGTIERDGGTKPMPAAMATHEALQFGIYGYMLLVRASAQIKSIDTVIFQHPGYPPAAFTFGTDGLALSAVYDVAAPDGGDTIRQRFHFADWKTEQGIQWPRTVMIFQNDQPFFTSNLDSFSVELA